MKSTVVKTICLGLCMLLVGACGTTMKKAQVNEDEAMLVELEEQQEALKKREAALNSREKLVNSRENQVDKKLKAALSAEEQARAAEARSRAGQATPPPVVEPLLPPGAKAGECYARVFVPNKYKYVTEELLKKEAGERIEIIPPKYQTVTEKVMVKESSEKLEVVPATYEWVEETVLIKPSSTKLVTVPETYEMVSEEVLVRAAHLEWKKGTGPIQKIDQATGEIMCLVEEPDIYKTVTKKVLKTPATTKKVEIPAEYKTIKKRVMKTPPTTRVVTIPAEYKTVNVVRLVEPERQKRITIPAEYQTVTKKVKVSDGHMEWRSILCQTNMTVRTLSDIQRALQKAGYDPGPIDGVIGKQTMQAVNAFQRDKGLVVSPYLTMNTLNALNVSPR